MLSALTSSKSGSNRCRPEANSAPVGFARRASRRQPLSSPMMADSAAGIDGWSGSEVAAWPAHAWSIFLQLWHQWLDAGALPEVLCHYRQVFLPKEDGPHGAVHAKDLSLIAIQSVLCRTIASAMARDADVKAWFLSKVNLDTHGSLEGRGVATAMVKLLETWEQPTAILIALDLAKGFDMLEPRLALGLMGYSGFSKRWLQHFSLVWSKQRRWLQVGRFLAGTPTTVTSSVPQGDPMGPLAFVLTLAEAAASFREERLEAAAEQALFIDDRSLIVHSPRDAVCAIAHWSRWSARLGLSENLRKLQIVARSEASRRALLEAGVNPSWLAEQARVLGVDFTQGSQQEPATAARRWSLAQRILSRIKLLSVSFVCKMHLLRSRVGAVATWGRWIHPVRETESFRMASEMKRAVKAHTAGSRNLWELLQGHFTNLKFLALQNSFTYLVRALRFWQEQGSQYSGGAWFTQLRAGLLSMGFSQLGNIFMHAQHGQSFQWPWSRASGDFEKWLGQAQHALRETWRREHFNRFLAHRRRDVEQLRASESYHELTVKKARQLYWDTSQSGRACLVRAGFSLAAFSKMREEQVDSICPFCEAPQTPHWDHLIWQCSAFAEGRPPMPAAGACTLQRRLGWPAHGASHVSAKEFLAFMASVREKVRAHGGFH